MPKPLIDCDVHPGIQTVRDLLPYMSEYWQEQFTNRGIDGLDLATYPPNAPLTCRPDWREKGAKPGVRLEGLRAAVLDGFGAELAICNPLYGGQVAMSEQMGAAVCSAVNQWLAREWLDREPRLRGSIVVHSGNAALAAEEIDRWAADRRFVQVQLLVGNELMLGRNQYWPIYEAAQRHGLPVGIHAGTMYRYPSTSSGWPAHLLQDYASMTHMFAAQLQSLLMEGVFARFPDLRFVLIESGVTWLPSYLWRAVKTWRGTRGEVPWVKRSPLLEIRERVRFTIQPFDSPGDSQAVERLMEQIGSDEMLLFSSDYPHWQFDGDDPMPPGIPAHMLDKIGRENALNTYPRLRELVQ